MKLFNHVYNDQKTLQAFVQHRFNAEDHLLIQLFCGDTDLTRLQTILDYLHRALPQSAIIGSSTAGEVYNGVIHRRHIVISFCVLENTRAEVHYLPEVSAKSAQENVASMIGAKTKLCIAFAETFDGDSESFLHAFHEVAPQVAIAGGNAADDFLFQNTYVIHANRIEKQGVALAFLSGDALQIHQHYALGWTQIGKVMTVTRAHNGIVYDLDHRPIDEVYLHYLGEEIVHTLPANNLSFPLIKLQSDMEVCRSQVRINEDRSFRFAGHFEEGEQVRFGFCNVEEVMRQAKALQKKVRKDPVEAIFIYSCSLRHLFLKEQLHYEFGLLEQIAPTVGFFTYGEFFHSPRQNYLLNVTTTVLALSESTFEPKPLLPFVTKPNPSAFDALIHLINTTQHELDENIHSLNQYKMILDHSAIVSKMDLEGRITYVNDAFCQVSGFSEEELLGSSHSRFRHPEAALFTYLDVWETLRQRCTWQGVLHCINRYGGAFYIKTTIMPFLDEHNNEVVEYITSSIDVTELFIKDRIIREQLIDELTGLGNRQALFHEMRNYEGEQLMVLINVIDFSEINDYLGYDVGDMLLKEIGVLLQERFKNPNRFVAFRINGDEFALLLQEEEDPLWKRHVQDKLKRLVRALEKHLFMIQGYEVVIRLNVGMAVGFGEQIYKQAHIALKEAKRRDQVMVSFNAGDTLKRQTEQNIQIIHKIKHAIEHDRIVPFYQGIYDNRLKKITKYEVLMRLQEEDGTYLSPYRFLEQAKKTRLYEKLTKIMIRKSFDYLHDKGVDFSLNLTKGDILSSSVKECLCAAIRQYGCGKRVILEIVESEGIDTFDEVRAFIQEMKALGCKIAIDDFGTGYSNFAYLAQLSADFIKIDGSLVKEIDTDRTKAMTVETIISFAHKMNYQIVAEFVDHPSVQTKLEHLHVDFSQGYLFSKPHSVVTV
jgi:PAS domain S-box-containing protein/diguanylate cyclase (GGDEF)-like protein